MTGTDSLLSSLKKEGIEILGPVTPEYAKVLTYDAMKFIAELSRNFTPRIKELLALREKRQKEIDEGKMPDFLPETKHIREAEWTVAPLPEDLLDRRVEITGPTDRKMIINALNSGANVYMADFEDANSPTWHNMVQGQINLIDAVKRTITYTSPEGKFYQLNEKIATLMVRPRGIHLPEKHVKVDGETVPGCLFDFGLFFFHNANTLIQQGTGPYFYLPKLQSHLEARLWNDVFVFSEKYLGIPVGTIKATVLIEHILAAFEMDEILYELKEHSAGLNCGRWDYIFSIIKVFRKHPTFIFPDRAQVTMTRHCMKSYVELLIKTCHRRNVHAMGGMAAQIPRKDDPTANEEALNKVREDKLREVKQGHDGTWVAHPGLVPIAKAVFDEYMKTANQIHVKREDVHVTAEDLLKVPSGTITEEGIRININVGLKYLESWLRSNGCVAINYLMEDTATAEICRTQLWQWVHHNAKTDKGIPITKELFRSLMKEELEKIKAEIGEDRFTQSKFELAAQIFDDLITNPEFKEFLTLEAYKYLD